MKKTCLFKYEQPTPRPSPRSADALAARLPLHLLLTAAAFVVFLVVATNAASAQQMPLTLIDDWTGAPFGTNAPSAELDHGIVRFRGAIAGGINDFAFDMPASLIPPQRTAYMPLDLCDATEGELVLVNIGTVVSESNDFNDEQCFTSLDGVSFLFHKGSQPLTLINGSMTSQLDTGSASASLISGIVHLRGGIQEGSTANPFVMPPSLRPASTVFIPVALGCTTPDNGRLQIDPDGTVTIEAESGILDDATCFTSLDGCLVREKRVRIHPAAADQWLD
jgi:hypothetical protein